MKTMIIILFISLSIDSCGGVSNRMTALSPACFIIQLVILRKVSHCHPFLIERIRFGLNRIFAYQVDNIKFIVSLLIDLNGKIKPLSVSFRVNIIL